MFSSTVPAFSPYAQSRLGCNHRFMLTADFNVDLIRRLPWSLVGLAYLFFNVTLVQELNIYTVHCVDGLQQKMDISSLHSNSQTLLI